MVRAIPLREPCRLLPIVCLSTAACLRRNGYINPAVWPERPQPLGDLYGAGRQCCDSVTGLPAQNWLAQVIDDRAVERRIELRCPARLPSIQRTMPERPFEAVGLDHHAQRRPARTASWSSRSSLRAKCRRSCPTSRSPLWVRHCAVIVTLCRGALRGVIELAMAAGIARPWLTASYRTIRLATILPARISAIMPRWRARQDSNLRPQA